jgi:hypothetical protein
MEKKAKAEYWPASRQGIIDAINRGRTYIARKKEST